MPGTDKPPTHTFIVSSPIPKLGAFPFSREWLLCHPERSGARLCLAASHLPPCRLSATARNPARLPKMTNFWPSILPNLHHTVLRAAPETRRRLAVVPSIRIEGTTARLRRGSGGAMEASAGDRGGYFTQRGTAKNHHLACKSLYRSSLLNQHGDHTGAPPGCRRQYSVGT
jgi:hypothetical protein